MFVQLLEFLELNTERKRVVGKEKGMKGGRAQKPGEGERGERGTEKRKKENTQPKATNKHRKGTKKRHAINI